ncbi:DUF1501 domain-containing protein [Nocardioides sp. R-C-SC26]|uniref:DUF1501 domain-containing protein n=1 Tax=Nocardioides sp. R-C-SC26 TaxID=2870414 RepID=UPI001E631ED0|nr:DUF1501 domain-containing protein [Nocardioides sp. R-C-SC26]
MTHPSSPLRSCCAEGAALDAGPTGPSTTRRGLLRGAALAGATVTIGSTVVSMAPAGPRPAPAPPRGGGRAGTQASPWAIVVLSLRGAADGLSLVVPHGDPNYYAARPRIAVPKDRLWGADAMFGLHPALGALQPLWDGGSLAAVHAAGLPAPNRSHFSAMEEVEDADPGSSARTGWLNRLLGTDGYASPLQGLSVGARPAAMIGPEPTMAVSSVGAVRVAGASKLDASDRRFASLDRAWSRSSLPMAGGMRAALEAASDFRAVQAVKDTSSTYPNNDLGRALHTVSRTVKADVGSAVFTVDHGNWDMHTDIGSVTGGWMFNQATTLSTAIAAFFRDLGPSASKVTLVTISEFGRRTVENAERGLDHGWGNAMLLAGAGVRGGQYYGRWPGLTVSGDADLKVTTDYRSVLAEVIGARTAASTAAVFPGFQPESVGAVRRS